MPGSSERSAKDKVMVYLPSELRRGMAIVAAERGIRISAAFAEAAGEYLQSRRRGAASLRTKPAPAAETWSHDATTAVIKRIDGYRRVLMEIHAYTADLVPAVDTRALAIVIAGLNKAGPLGLDTPQVRALLAASAFHAVKTTSVRDALLQAGVARIDQGRFYLASLGPTP